MPTILGEILAKLRESNEAHSFDETVAANACTIDSAWDLFQIRVTSLGIDLPPEGSDDRMMLIASVMVGITIGFTSDDEAECDQSDPA